MVNAKLRSAIDGGDFGRNLQAEIPNIIASALGDALHYGGGSGEGGLLDGVFDRVGAWTADRVLGQANANPVDEQTQRQQARTTADLESDATKAPSGAGEKIGDVDGGFASNGSAAETEPTDHDGSLEAAQNDAYWRQYNEAVDDYQYQKSRAESKYRLGQNQLHDETVYANTVEALEEDMILPTITVTGRKWRDTFLLGRSVIDSQYQAGLERGRAKLEAERRERWELRSLNGNQLQYAISATLQNNDAQALAVSRFATSPLLIAGGPASAVFGIADTAINTHQNGLNADTVGGIAAELTIAAAASKFGPLARGFRACFVAGTPVHTKDGLKPIEAIQTGDKVWSRSEHDEGEPTWRSVINTVAFEDKEIWSLAVRTLDGRRETYRATGNHPFWVEFVKGVEDKGGWTAVELLEPGDQLRLANGEAAFVDEVFDTGETEAVYNMEVDGFHTYHIGELGVWVHNDNCPDPSRWLPDNAVDLVRRGPEWRRYIDEGQRAHDSYADYAKASGLTVPQANLRVTIGNRTVEFRPDAIDHESNIVRELKPDTITGRITGSIQSARYKVLMERLYGGEWTSVVDYYKPFGK